MGAKGGFSLIEALVALSIAAISLTAIFSLEQQLAAGQRRAEAAMARVSLRQNMLAAVHDLNPTSQPAGAVTLPPNLVFRWTSEPLTVEKLNTGFPIGDGLFRVRLYRVTVVAYDQSNTPLANLTVERVGWVRTSPAGLL
jgi:general secretion pathway protein I